MTPDLQVFANYLRHVGSTAAQFTLTVTGVREPTTLTVSGSDVGIALAPGSPAQCEGVGTLECTIPRDSVVTFGLASPVVGSTVTFSLPVVADDPDPSNNAITLNLK